MTATINLLIITSLTIVQIVVWYELFTKISRLEENLRTASVPLWSAVQKQIVRDLHQPHMRYLEMDTLLEKLESMTISPTERDRLKVLLEERSIDMTEDVTMDQRISAKMMSLVMEKVQFQKLGGSN